jgi:hypothetical protein
MQSKVFVNGIDIDEIKEEYADFSFGDYEEESYPRRPANMAEYEWILDFLRGNKSIGEQDDLIDGYGD